MVSEALAKSKARNLFKKNLKQENYYTYIKTKSKKTGTE